MGPPHGLLMTRSKWLLVMGSALVSAAESMPARSFAFGLCRHVRAMRTSSKKRKKGRLSGMGRTAKQVAHRNPSPATFLFGSISRPITGIIEGGERGEHVTSRIVYCWWSENSSFMRSQREYCCVHMWQFSLISIAERRGSSFSE